MTKEKQLPFDLPKKPSPIKAIRKFCIQCGGGTFKEVENCQLRKCPLHPYRFGVMPSTYLANKHK